MSAEILCPVEALAAVEAVCGEDTVLKLISRRRGSSVWQCSGRLRAVALKVGVGPDGAEITARETKVLIEMGAGHSLLGRGRGFGSGQAAAWMLTPWYDGPSTWEIFREVRASTGRWEAARAHASDLCKAVAQLHAAGWVHADLQPQHAIHTGEGVRLIDCSWAWHPTMLLPSGLFRGGRPHFLAPELARSIHEGVRPVAPLQPAEVYALAASLWTAITGTWPLDYARIGVDPDNLTPAVLRQIIGTQRIPLRGPQVWPDVQDVLREVLTKPAERRLTAAELARKLL
ncbi:hypothetical protein [Streptomyces sp. NPDC059009]|uniref:hypothetical protein n=1 Tax=Streptomyces sp. NPDC059009 TaxID=3346694 RepID=UPI0036C7ACEA